MGHAPCCRYYPKIVLWMNSIPKSKMNKSSLHIQLFYNSYQDMSLLLKYNTGEEGSVSFKIKVFCAKQCFIQSCYKLVQIIVQINLHNSLKTVLL